MRVLICFLCGGRRSLHFFDVPRYPRLVDRGFRRAVKSQDNEVALAWNRREPVTLVPFTGFGTEIDIGRAIGILFQTIPIEASIPSQSESARFGPSPSTSNFSWSNAVASLRGSIFAGTPEASGNFIGSAMWLNSNKGTKCDMGFGVIPFIDWF